MKEPDKWEQYVTPSGKKNWRTTQEWKDWRKQVLSNGFRDSKKVKVPKGRIAPVTPENHKESWKVLAWFAGTDTREILVCACRSQRGPYDGCGAMGIRNTRQSKITVILESRFE